MAAHPRRRGVCLGVSGSVAAVKAPELAEALLARGVDVDLVVTDSAHALLQARYRDAVPWHQLLQLRLQYDVLHEEAAARSADAALAAPVLRIWRNTDEWEGYTSVGTSEVLHVELAKRNQLLLIAPLCANTLGKAALGLCDSLLTCVLRAWYYDLDESFAAPLAERFGAHSVSRPVLVAPAMNTFMWHQRVTGAHMQALEARGVHSVPPVSKVLACGDEGVGAMGSVDDIAEAAMQLLDNFWREVETAAGAGKPAFKA